MSLRTVAVAQACVLAVAAAVVISPRAAAQADTVRRLALVIGINDGGPERARLRYAATDAEAFGRVLEQVGGVAPSDVLWVLDGDRASVMRALGQLRERVEAARHSGVHVEVLLYYSGHSDEEGLLLRGQLLSYHELRAEVAALPADVRVVVLDSCSSGAVARAKGGQLRPAFLVDASAQVRGQAILTSSSENEVSQESDRLRGSFFTHHLISGLRGAADVTHDGRVTLTEAYQYAFQETLARTESTLAGSQHPSYEIELAGTGDLVVTDLRSSAAGLVLAAPLSGRVFVRDDSGALVVEVNKRAGDPVELGLPAGRYAARLEWPGGSGLADVSLRDGKKVTLSRADFTATSLEVASPRGDGPPLRRVAVNVSLFPAFSTNDVVPEPVENNFAIGIATRSAALTGVALGLIGTWVDQDARMFQGALVGNVAGANVRGGQAAIGLNLAGASMSGVQLAGFYNGVGSDVTGLQVAPGGNTAKGSLRGIQLAGLVNGIGTSSVGLQIAPGFNISRADLQGLQLSVIGNWAGGIRGLQWGALNYGHDVSGGQVGVVNVAHQVRGIQLGFINIADDVDGAPIGIINYVRHGQLHGELFASDLEPVNLAVKMGNRWAYSTLMAGTGRAATSLLGYGLGAHLAAARWSVDVDATGGMLIPDVSLAHPLAAILQIRGMLALPLTHSLAVFAGPTLNLLLAPGENAPTVGSYFPPTFDWAVGTAEVRLWPGVELGIRL